ncbi:hypothetical protein OFC23_30725, partial [Escherichia coli]|nr:hypothetical protein [Escherichia coli]
GNFLDRFRKEIPNRPETTEGREGFLHPYIGNLDVETSVIKILLRDFEIAGLAKQEAAVKRLIEETQKEFPEVKIEYSSALGYLN